MGKCIPSRYNLFVKDIFGSTFELFNTYEFICLPLSIEILK